MQLTKERTDCETDYKTIEYEIAKLDRQIIFRLAQRICYQRLARQVKHEGDRFQSVENFQTMLELRKSWAIAAGVEQNVVHKLAQYAIDYYLTELNRNN